ncbi:TetR/AcrR family transcriptional regulator [Allokutzneria oryzae]|uniref:TetR/AcrR family transcriptional regulator n=1 Tax=Allokutzneria oryzae TaxID=1378989 RepID=A0ABV5ZUK1_9PSEU
MTSTRTQESGSRSRTRRAIVDAAIVLLAARPTASLAEVAEAANVGRSTLHRYFPERSELLSAIMADSVERLRSGIEAAELDKGTPAEALRRVVQAYFELSPILALLVGESTTEQNDDLAGALDAVEAPVRQLIERGRAEGCFDERLSTDWISRVLWWVVHAGVDAVNDGGMARHAALESIIRTLEGGVLATPSG